MSEKELLDFLGNLSALMRGDLATLYNGINDSDTKKQREENAQEDIRIAVMDKSYYRLLRLAENLNDAKYLSSTRPFSLQLVDLVKFVGEICEKCTSAAYDSGKTVAFHCSLATLVWQVNKESFESMVYHLISNALKYSDDHTTIAIHLSQQDHQLQLQVQDTGCGMDEAQIAKALALVKTEHVYTNIQRGFGLGLPIVQSIVNHHGGTMTIHSKPAQGTTVTITLPQGDTSHIGFADVPAPYETRSGFNPTLIHLADALPVQAFTICKQD